jgi:hypothetical protein
MSTHSVEAISSFKGKAWATPATQGMGTIKT